MEKLIRAILVGVIAGLVFYFTNPYDLNFIVTLLIGG
ncbi:F0F1-type ATP synthase assembly protein I [Cytobacillus horneckiae]